MLPSGMYQGTITNLIPGEIAPFALISLSEESKLIVLIGLEGWTPAIVATDELERGARIKVAANGLLLELTGTEIDGELVGYFRNVMNDAQGKWSASPVRAAAEGDGL